MHGSSYLDDADVYDDEQISSDDDENWFDKNITAGKYIIDFFNTTRDDNARDNNCTFGDDR